MNYRMTVKELKNACNKHKYLLLRYSDGDLMGVNGLAAGIAGRKTLQPDNTKTKFIGYQPCNFDAYISHKLPFYLTSKTH